MQPTDNLSHSRLNVLLLCEPVDLSNNSSLHLQFIFSWQCDSWTVLAHLSLALNSSVFMGETMDLTRKREALNINSMLAW